MTVELREAVAALGAHASLAARLEVTAAVDRADLPPRAVQLRVGGQRERRALAGQWGR